MRLSFFFISELVLIYSSKLRNWMGPSQYIQGSSPTPLDSFGFSSVGGNFYVFAGWDQNNGSNYRIITFTIYLALLSNVILVCLVFYCCLAHLQPSSTSCTKLILRIWLGCISRPTQYLAHLQALVMPSAPHRTLGTFIFSVAFQLGSQTLTGQASTFLNCSGEMIFSKNLILCNCSCVLGSSQ